MRSVSAGHWKLTMANWEQSLKSILLQLHEKLLNSMLTILWLFSLWSKLERWKSLISGCLVSWSQVKKRHRFEVSYLTAWNTNQPILNWIVTCDEKWLLYNNHKCPAQWLDPEEAPKHFPKPHCLVVCCPSDLLQLSESQKNHYIWEVCSANWWDAWKTAGPTASTGQQKRPNYSLW